MSKILNWFTGGLVKEVGKVIDNLFTSDEERLKVKNEVFKVLQEQQLELQKLQTEIILAEANGNWLTKKLATNINAFFWLYSYLCKIYCTYV